MIILTIRTDKPEAEIGLYKDTKQIAYETWQAHRELSVTIHKKIDDLLNSQKKTWKDVDGIVCFKGPGSFTGLRIGLTLGNTLADALHVGIVSSNSKTWQTDGIERIKKGETEKVATPEYGSDAHITKQKR